MAGITGGRSSEKRVLGIEAWGRDRKRGLLRVAAAIVLAGLAGCAGSVAPATVVTALPADQRATLHLTGVTTEAGQGVKMTVVDTNRITQLVLADIRALSPGMLEAAAGQMKSVRIVITRYDEGSAGGRLLLAGIGQIRLDGDVTFVDTSTGMVVGEYKVSKQFAFGGLYGALTSIQDVEKGFAQSVAELVKPAP